MCGGGADAQPESRAPKNLCGREARIGRTAPDPGGGLFSRPRRAAGVEPEGRSIELPVRGGGPSPEQEAQLRRYFEAMPVEDILAGLKFAESRRAASEAGALRVGRRSIIRREVHSVTGEQARWRLANWKTMIQGYRRKGYSYPTISRIKKALAEKAAAP